MMKSHRGKSAARRLLVDISNGGKSLRLSKKSRPKSTDDGGAVDRLLLVRSDLSNLIGQVDDLVARAIESKTSSNQASLDIDSFAKFLSDMHSSLKPWFSRLQQSLDNDPTVPENKFNRSSSVTIGGEDAVATKKDPSELELIVSPSPLVSWRAGTCTVDCGRQLFLLTPLPKSKANLSRYPGSSKTLAKIFMDNEKSDCHQLPPPPFICDNARDDLVRDVDNKQGPTNLPNSFSFERTSATLESPFLSPVTFSNQKKKTRSIHLLTPCLPKSSVLLGPIIKSSQKDGGEASKLREDKNNVEVSISSSDEVSNSLAIKYQGLLGIQPAPRFSTRRKEVDETLDWFLSPPKTCILLEPPDEKPLLSLANVLLSPVSAGLSFATPACKVLESTQKGRLPGEATLKRELWTKFEATSTNQLHFDASVFQRTSKKGFLDMLEEVSAKTSDSNVRTAR